MEILAPYPINTCVYSSLVFLTNVIAAYLNGEYIYGTACLALTCSSFVFHSSRDTVFYTALFYTDQACIFCVFLCGLCLLIVKPFSFTKIMAFLSFFTVIYMHYLSDITIEADKWHSILHYIGSLGHHCILL